jgi:hypothetical protein
MRASTAASPGPRSAGRRRSGRAASEEKLPSRHSVAELSGSPSVCGREYGASQAESIRAFLALTVAPDKRRLAYAARCWRVLAGWKRPVVEFVRGMAAGAGLSLEEATLLLLHEEICHLPHCTAFGATGAASQGGPILAQNWDWDHSLYPWASLVRLRSDSAPATLTYAYPGLWASAGMNEHGLALVWTGAGYFPRLRPRDGVTTYALSAGVLACGSTGEAVALLERTQNAGAFIFFVGDAAGDVRVVEGVPGKVEVECCRGLVSRANHYELEPIIRMARQRVPPATLRANTRSRGRRMRALLDEHRGPIGRRAAEVILSDHGVQPGLDICQHPVPGRRGLTLDSFYALPARRELWIARGSPCRHDYVRYVV